MDDPFMRHTCAMALDRSSKQSLRHHVFIV
jgi:hypothetical protein